jgi:conjugal transfer/entry exclusion protein
MKDVNCKMCIFKAALPVTILTLSIVPGTLFASSISTTSAPAAAVEGIPTRSTGVPTAVREEIRTAERLESYLSMLQSLSNRLQSATETLDKNGVRVGQAKESLDRLDDALDAAAIDVMELKEHASQVKPRYDELYARRYSELRTRARHTLNTGYAAMKEAARTINTLIAISTSVPGSEN